uniref:hypothetical protein n=1 Tax=Parapedobacter pyrenivorans TaxID=1305674 RepID=UPI00333FE290
LPLYENVVYNDSLSLFVPSFGDVAFVRDVKKLRRRVRDLRLAPGDSVLLWGTAEAPPFYAFAITISDTCNGADPMTDDAVFHDDTCVNGRLFRLIGLSEDAEAAPAQKDLASIWSRIGFDTLSAGQFMPIFSVTGVNTNKYYHVLNNVAQYSTWSDQDRWSKLQLELTYASFLGDNAAYRQALAMLERNMMSDSVVRHVLASTPSVHGNDALDTIVAEARKRQLVMINENHFYPNHRLLVYDLLDALHIAGYRYLALEALDPEQEEVVNRTHRIDLETGFYTREQQYGRLLSRALELGFELVAYENTDNTKDREAGQAEHLYQKTFAKDPSAKVLVLAGMDHILETATPSGKKWMAALFKERYGIDPLTVSQNDLKHLRHLAPDDYQLLKADAFESDRLRAVDYHVINSRPVVFVRDAEWLVYRNPRKDSVQVLLFHTEKPASVAMATEVPYFTTVVPGKSKTRIPCVSGKPTLVVAYDRYGSKVVGVE